MRRAHLIDLSLILLLAGPLVAAEPSKFTLAIPATVDPLTVLGPASVCADNQVARWNGASNTSLQCSSIKAADTGGLTEVPYVLSPSGSEFTLQTGSNNKINFVTDGAIRWLIEATYTAGNEYFSGGLVPNTDNVTVVGSVTKRVKSLYVGTSVINESGNGAEWISGQVSELVTIAAAATTDTTIDLPANSVIRAVVARTTVLIPTAATYTIGDPTTPARFATGCGVAADATCIGTLHADQTGAGGPRQVTAAKVRITPDASPADNTGRVRVTVFYDSFSAPGS